MKLTEAATPALILDQTKFEANCSRMLEKCRSLGVKLRPHMKTLKSIEASRYAIDPEHGGIAVSTLNEAAYFAGHGISDIQYAVCISPDKLARAAALTRQARLFSFFVDSADAARAVVEAGRAEETRFNVWIEIDTGGQRTGIRPDDPELQHIASILVEGGMSLRGVATHAGHSYGCNSVEEVAAVAEQERSGVVEAAERLRSAGFEMPGVSAGSTPTALHAQSGEGLTEMRPGVYMAGDLFQCGAGSLTLPEAAATVLATVISHNRARNEIVVDAGGLALSKDRSVAAGRDLGYGLVLDVTGAPVFGDIGVGGVHQEHGQIRSESPLPFDALPIGAKVRILPNHICMTAAMYERYLLVRGEDEVVGEWGRTNGWS